jgi:glycosyltransferase involved in cell wall biosynthesis
MKVAFFSHDAELYGATRSLVALIEGLNKLNVSCYLILPHRGSIISLLEQKNITYICIYYSYWINKEDNSTLQKKIVNFKKKAIRLYSNYLAFVKLKAKIIEWDIDIIYTNTSIIPIGAFLALATGKKHIWHIREYIDKDYAHQLDWGKYIFYYLLKKSSAIIFNSNAVKEYHTKYFKLRNTHVVYNGILFESDFDSLRNTARSVKKPTIYTFLLVGTIMPSKGQHLAAEAITHVKKIYPNVKLILVGRGEENYVSNLREKFGIEQGIEYWGSISDPYKAYLASHALLMCSSSEAWGRVTAEAMSACLPTIGTKSAGTIEIIQDNVTGLLFNGTVDSLVSCMKKFIDNPEWAAQLGYNGWLEAHKKYTIERYANDIFQILENVNK